MLGRSEFALRRGFAAQNTRTVQGHRPTLWVPFPSSSERMGVCFTQVRYRRELAASTQERGVAAFFMIHEVRGPRKSEGFCGVRKRVRASSLAPKIKGLLRSSPFYFWVSAALPPSPFGDLYALARRRGERFISLSASAWH